MRVWGCAVTRLTLNSILRVRSCQVCPAREAIKGDGRCTIEIYNPMLKVWSSADASVITWKERKACMLSCYDISRYKS